MALRYALALPLMMATASAVVAQDSTDCRNGLFSTQAPFALAEVQGGERAFFHGDMNGCPWTRGACSSPSYVVPGDTVIISKTRSGYACAFFPSDGGGTAGWVPSRQLRLLPVENRPPLSAWTGQWSSEGNPVLAISNRIGGLRVSGQSFWPGPPGSTDYPSTHIGELGGQIRISGHTGFYEDSNLCKVRFTLLGSYLIAGDNRKCGGANVSFSAVYQRVGD